MSINVCTLIPNGNVRMEVMGLDPRPADRRRAEADARLVREGMEQGAVGLSSGLDYIPSLYADEDELTELCEEIAPFGGVYVTHMRGLRPAEGIGGSMEEVFSIGQRAGCGVHVSHFNCLADQAIPLLDAARGDGVDVTFDLYCYLYGSTIVAHDRAAAGGAGGRHRGDARRGCSDPAVRLQLRTGVRQPAVPDRDDPPRRASRTDEYRHFEGHARWPTAVESTGKLDRSTSILRPAGRDRTSRPGA